MLGWRGRLGLIVPANNTVIEPEFNRWQPEGVTTHASRIMASGTGVRALQDMVTGADRAAREVMVAECGVLLYACFSTSIAHGTDWDASFRRRLSKSAGAPCLSAYSVTVEALHQQGIRRPLVLSAYNATLARSLTDALTTIGIEPAAHVALSARNMSAIGELEPWSLQTCARTNWCPTADGVCIVGTDLRAAEAACEIAADLDVPVVTTNKALFTAGLESLGVDGPKQFCNDHPKPVERQEQKTAITGSGASNERESR